MVPKDKKIIMFGVPSCTGGNIEGCEKGPEALRQQLEPMLAKAAAPQLKEINDLGDLELPETCTIENIHKRCLPEIDQIAHDVETFTLQRQMNESENFPILIGGDHSVTYGFIKAMASQKKRGLIWFDAHGDFNTPSISPSGNIHGMVLAALAGKGLAEEVFPGQLPPISEKNICIVGARNLDPEEKELLDKSGVSIFTIKEIREKGLAKVTQEALAIAAQGTEGVHLSFDMDFFDPQDAPGLGVPEGHGIHEDEVKELIQTIKNAPEEICSFDVVELNPDQDKKSKTAKLAAKIVTQLLQ